MENTVKMKIFTRTPRNTNGLIQMISMDESIGQKGVKYLPLKRKLDYCITCDLNAVLHLSDK